ncbi:MAG: hypothetical protein N3G22_00800 [Candidatus Micrarchaeota archaeon]|nr:hypothetical protein [Candidatus Micrarchaeota archaeon]
MLNRKIAILSVALLMLVALASAQRSGLSALENAIRTLCSSLNALLPVVAMLMVLVAGVIYAAGQIMGAETRARANVWATAALTGALIALLIYSIAPQILFQLYNTGSATSTDWINQYCR